MSEHRKRLDVLCEVIERCAGHPDLHFLVLGYFRGHEDERERWERFLERHPNVTWVSGLNHWETPPYFSAADVYLSTSGYTGADFEGLSLAAVQALAAGLPVVSTASGGQREVVTEGVNGYLTPTGDAGGLADRLKDLCRADPAVWREFRARNTAKAAADFDIRGHARRYETICWTLKNAIDAALPYDPGADVQLLDFADADRLSAAQRHQASFFLNHVAPLLIDAGRTRHPRGKGDAGSTGAAAADGGGGGEDLSLLRSVAAETPGSIVEVGGDRLSAEFPDRVRRATDRGASTGLGMVVLHRGLSYHEVGEGLRFAADALAAGGAVVIGGFRVPGGAAETGAGEGAGGGAGGAGLTGAAACALLDHLADGFPLWRRPYLAGPYVVLIRG